MSAYTLTHPESWALATLLHLPVQPGSALAGWLNSSPAPADGVAPAALQSLSMKGYYYGEQAQQPIPAGLLAGLTLTSVNAAELTAIIRTGKNAALTRFAQVGGNMVQYGADEYSLTLQDLVPMSRLAQKLLPGWFSVSHSENLWVDLPLGAFMLFKHACALEDWAAARSGFVEQGFGQAELLESFQRNAGWADIFSDIGLKGMQPVGQMPLADYLSQLITRGYLLVKPGGVIEIGTAGRPLASVFSDPVMCTLSLSMLIWEEDRLESGAFIYGAGRLFWLNFNVGRVSIQQCDGAASALAWINKLLSKGSQARYLHYQIPPVGTKPAQVVARPALQVQPGLPINQAPAPRPPLQSPAPVWYYMDRGKQAGPVDEQVLRNWIAQRMISPDTLVWNQTLTGWVKVSQTRLFSNNRATTVPCPRCGAPVNPGIRYCGRCGHRL